MARVPVFDNEACFDQHFCEAPFTEVFRDEVLFAVPGTELLGGVFRKEAVYGNGQFSAWFENTKAFAESGLGTAEMLEAADADDTVEGFVFETKGFGEAVNVAGSRPVQPLRSAQSLWIGLQPVRRLEMPGEAFRPEAVTAADIEQSAARGFIGALAEQSEFAVPVERTVAADCGVQAVQYAHFNLGCC